MPGPLKYHLYADHYEEGGRLVLTHVFHGETEHAAIHVFEAHMKSDAFLRACVEEGLFEGNVPCEVKYRWVVDP